MDSKCCRLFDDEVVRNIMMAVGSSVYDYMRQRKNADEDEVYDFVDANAEAIIADTLDEMENSAYEDEEPGGQEGNRP